MTKIIVMTLLGFSILSAFAESARPVKTTSILQELSDECANIATQANADAFACFTVESFAVSNASDSAVKAIFDELRGFSAEVVDASEAAQEITTRFNEQANSLVDISDDLWSQVMGLSEELQAYVQYAHRRGARILMDNNTYWAPSVNASAVLIVWPQLKRVEVILHGDTDD